MIFSKIKRKLKSLLHSKTEIVVAQNPIDEYIENGKVAWSNGYNEYKWKLINETIQDIDFLNKIRENILPLGYGKNMDERVIEYPWLFSQFEKGGGTFLDAGSTFNFNSLLQMPIIKEKDRYIYTFYPEHNNFLNERISYAFGDLRDLPFKDNLFNTVVCHSTLEHIDMDNSMYGYELSHTKQKNTKSYEYLKVIKELERVTKSKGKILLTFPYGKFENHGFFQQFDNEMLQKIIEVLSINYNCKLNFAKYQIDGWHFAKEAECSDSFSYNPHTGVGKGEDGAAHSRAICFVQALKN